MSCYVCMNKIVLVSLCLSIYIYMYISISIDIPVLLWPITCTVWFTSQSTFICNIHSFMNGFVPWKFHGFSHVGLLPGLSFDSVPEAPPRETLGFPLVSNLIVSKRYILCRFQWGFQYVHFKSNLEHIILEHEVFDFHHSPLKSTKLVWIKKRKYPN